MLAPPRGPPGRASLVGLLGLLAQGCQSELEIWGVRHVLPGPPVVPPYTQQLAVALPFGRRVALDAAYLDARVAVELDGAAFHGSREQRERDLRGDSALAAAGWIVLRFSYARLVSDPGAADVRSSPPSSRAWPAERERPRTSRVLGL